MIHHNPVWLLAVCLGLVSASPLMGSDPVRCCVPHKYEIQADMTYDVQGSYVSVGEFTRMSVDIDRQLISLDQVMNGNYELTTLMDYASKTMYIVTKATGHCEKSPIPGGISLESCIPATAKYVRRAKLGYGENTLDCDTWAFDLSPFKVITTVESVGCIPVREVLMMDLGGSKTSETMFFYNYTPGIKDPSVFDIPAECKETARPDVNQLSPSTRALVKKYARL